MNSATPSSDALLHHLAPIARSLRPKDPSFSQEDLRQDAVVRILSRLQSDQPPTLSRAYVRRAAKTAAIDGARRWSRREALLSTHAGAVQWARGPDDPERQLHSHELGRIIDEELTRLPEPRRDLLMMFLSGHGVSEIAKKKGIDRKRIDNWVYRALSTLRGRLLARGLTPKTVLGH
jgi:RNA polymerase sigma factor (sigma-70 family)